VDGEGVGALDGISDPIWSISVRDLWSIFFYING